MDNLTEKIGELLSDKESIKQISELAQMFMSDTSENSGKDEASNENDDIFGGIDFEKILKLQEIFVAFSEKDKNTELLTALKPYLKDEKKQKVDKAIKILKLLAVWNIVKESGMLNDFL